MEDISLMEMNSDECFEFPPSYLGEVTSCDVNKSIKHLQKHLVCVSHNLLVSTCTAEGNFSIPRPDELNTKDPNLHGKQGAIDGHCLLLLDYTYNYMYTYSHRNVFMQVKAQLSYQIRGTKVHTNGEYYILYMTVYKTLPLILNAHMYHHLGSPVLVGCPGTPPC